MDGDDGLHGEDEELVGANEERKDVEDEDAVELGVGLGQELNVGEAVEVVNEDVREADVVDEGLGGASAGGEGAFDGRVDLGLDGGAPGVSVHGSEGVGSNEGELRENLIVRSNSICVEIMFDYTGMQVDGTRRDETEKSEGGRSGSAVSKTRRNRSARKRALRGTNVGSSREAKPNRKSVEEEGGSRIPV